MSSVVSSDPFGNPTEVDVKQGGSTLVAKTVSSRIPTQAKTISSQSSTVSAEGDTYYDSYARPIRSAAQSSSGGWYVTDICYNVASRVHFQSYPYSAATLGSPVCSGLGDTTNYEALGRVTSIVHGDSGNTTATFVYTGAATKKTDENGAIHISQVNEAGRPTITCEISTIALLGVSHGSCGTMIAGTGFVTSYAYSTNTTALLQTL